MSKNTRIDWAALAAGGTGVLADGTVVEISGRRAAQICLERLLGEQQLSDAVDHYVRRLPGAELVRSVLWLVRPWSAMKRCHELFDSDADVDVRRSAVELLRVVGDERALPWVIRFLESADSEIQVWGVGLLDQLLWDQLVEEEECVDLLKRARLHSNPDVRGKARFIEQYLEERRRAVSR